MISKKQTFTCQSFSHKSGDQRVGTKVQTLRIVLFLTARKTGKGKVKEVQGKEKVLVLRTILQVWRLIQYSSVRHICCITQWYDGIMPHTGMLVCSHH